MNRHVVPVRPLRDRLTRLLCSTFVVGGLAVATPASAEVVADWSALTIQFTAANQPNRPPGPYTTIDQTIVHIATHDASRLSIPAVNAVSAPLIAQVDAAYTNYLINNGLAATIPGSQSGSRRRSTSS